MNRLYAVLLILGATINVDSALTLREIRTASDDVLVVFFTSTTIISEEVSTDNLSQWTVNGTAATAINRYVMQANSCDHHIYLTVPKLVNGTEYRIHTPHGDTTFTFDDRKTICESIKINQVAYSALSGSNYAYFAVWLGNGGSRQLSGALPQYEVFEVFTNRVVAQGNLTEKGSDATSGDFLYRIDLSGVPEGGPYKITVKGHGCSYQFGIGAQFSKKLAYDMFRGQLYQRCGCPLKRPWTDNDIRVNACHTTVYDVNGPRGEANIVVSGSEPQLRCIGGYHDAGDADRRAFHMSNPIVNLAIYEVFPDLFTDGQFNIPDKFDSEWNVTGQGNEIPDIIDEAEWGTLIWEFLQNSDGSIRFGTETKGYPSPFDAPLDKDAKLYGTVIAEDRVASVGAGLFLHLARIIKPFNEARSQQLAQRSRDAFDFVQTRMASPEKLYYYIQKYLYDGDENAHNQVKALQNTVDNYYRYVIGTLGYSLNDNNFDNPAYFISYLVEKDRPTDPSVVEHFRNALKSGADANLSELNSRAYPVGNNPANGGWGHNCRQQSYAFAPILYWHFSHDQAYFDAAADLMNYILGLNPIGISYVTGLGSHIVHNPHDRECAYTTKMGWGNKPGITVFGPGVGKNGTTVPAIADLPRERQFCDNRSEISMTEFTIFETMTHYSLYTVLANGGTWDKVDPFSRQSTAVRAKKETPAAPKVLYNPLSHTIDIYSSGSAFLVELYSLNGRKLFSRKSKAGSNGFVSVALPARHMRPGSYILKSTCDDFSEIRKLYMLAYRQH